MGVVICYEGVEGNVDNGEEMGNILHGVVFASRNHQESLFHFQDQDVSVHTSILAHHHCRVEH